MTSRVKELPELVGEFIELAKAYVRGRLVGPAKALGRVAGFGFAAGFLFFVAALFLAIAGTRALIDVMPDGNIWSGFGYIIASIGLLGLTGLAVWGASK